MDENAFFDREIIVLVRCGEDSKVVLVECMASLVTMISYGKMKGGIDGMSCTMKCHDDHQLGFAGDAKSCLCR